MDGSNPQYRLRQCFNCEESTDFFCSECDQNLCGRCRRKHLHDLSTKNHETVPYRNKGRNIEIEEICRRHPYSIYIYYCKKCKRPLCEYCQMDHRFISHSVSWITSVYMDVKQICCTIAKDDLFII